MQTYSDATKHAAMSPTSTSAKHTAPYLHLPYSRPIAPRAITIWAKINTQKMKPASHNAQCVRCLIPSALGTRISENNIDSDGRRQISTQYTDRRSDVHPFPNTWRPKNETCEQPGSMKGRGWWKENAVPREPNTMLS